MPTTRSRRMLSGQFTEAVAGQHDATVDASNRVGLHKSQDSAVPGLKGFRSGNAQDAVRGDALIVAATHGQIGMVRFLVEECGVAVNCKDHEGNSALMKAAETGRIDVVQFLVEQCGADVSAENKDKKTAVRLAADHGHHDIQRLLTPCISLSPTQPHGGHGSRFRKRLYRWAASLRAMLLTAKVFHHWPRMRLLRLCVDDATAMADGVVSTSAHSPGSSIPPSEIEVTRFTENSHVGGDFQAKWLDADAVVKLFIPDAAHSSLNDEVGLWQRLRHPNVIKMYGACEAGPGLQFFVCEFASNGSLVEYVTSSSSSERPTKMWKYLLEAALGLEYLHERGVVHGDLRCCNILIGSDGIAKLSNFALSGQKKGPSKDSSGVVGSMRWQAPEVLEGMIPSFESDVYSLGMCILEAATGKQPWGETDHWAVRHFKGEWVPETGVDAWYTPKCPHRTARALVWRMCCKAPRKRVKLASVVCELEHLAMEESSEPTQPEFDPTGPFGELEYDQMHAAWLRLQASMEKNENPQHYGAFSQLTTIQECLRVSNHQSGVFTRFHELLIEFIQMVTMAPEQALAIGLSSTRATSNSFYAIQRRVESLMVSLGLKDSVDAATESEVRWQQQRNAFVVSGITDTRLLLRSLKTTEERSAFLRRLRAIIKSPVGRYTVDQLRVMKKAYEDISSEVDTKDRSELGAPEWFIPWYELVIDEWNCLGEGGFGSVYRAKWLDSSVVVKRVILAGSSGKADASTTFCSSLRASEDLSTTQAQANAANTTAAEAMFRREVDIWFRFSHPHVVRLFGACHVDRPFFVCEYATNGTLTSYLRKNPQELWKKLHEAALGVQYLHARGVVHGDLKGNNIVIGSDLKAKVADFGLSSIANSNVSEALVSGAVHWVAPELLDGNGAPTFASDVYSLGMCIVEALRVVDAVASGKDSSYCLPWRVGDRTAVKYHATHGELPSRPRICEDDQWGLIQRMCALEPDKRIKISTVVDELALAAGIGVQSFGIVAAKWESVDEVVAEMQQLLLSLQEDGNQADATVPLYVSLWERLEHIHRRIDDGQSDASHSAFCSLVAASRESTTKLRERKRGIISLAETTMRCYALQRTLEKFCEAHFLVLGEK